MITVGDLKQLWTFIIAIVLSLWNEPAAQQPLTQNPNSHILRLPPELVLDVADFLSPDSQLLLSHSCRKLRTAMGHMTADRLSQSERLHYLTALGSNRAKKWVCEQCTTLHHADRHDCPSTPRNRSCQRPFDLSRRYYWHSSYSVYHRHVQLALKYSRLGQPKNQKHLKRLLAPFYDGFYTDLLRREVLITSFATTPKIVNRRYLQRSVYTYQQDTEPVTTATIGCLGICPHQGFGMLQWWPIIEERARQAGVPIKPPRPKDLLRDTMRQAFERPGKELRGSCELCPTDFSVKVTLAKATLRVWQDFGAEGTSLDRCWRAHVENNEGLWEAFGRERGSVRVLYENRALGQWASGL